jgi:hypothetical protein
MTAAQQLARQVGAEGTEGTAGKKSKQGKGRECVYIMSDDHAYVTKGAEKYRANLDVFVLADQGQPVEGMTVFDKKVDTAALFFLSIKLMSQRCYAFVGNFDSEVSEMAYQLLCLNRRTSCHAISMGKNGGEPESAEGG